MKHACAKKYSCIIQRVCACSVHAKMAEFTHRSFYRSRDRDRRAVLGSGTAQYTPDFSPGTSSEIAASHGYYAGSRGMHGIRTPPSSASPRLSARSRQGQPTFGVSVVSKY